MQPPVDATFAEQMRLLREARGWSQGGLARRMVDAGFTSYSQMTVSRTEKGERPIRLAEARELARILGTTVDEMLSEQDAVLVHRALFDARAALLDARDRVRAAQAEWLAAGTTAGRALRAAERPRSTGDDQMEQFIETLVGDVLRLLREPPDLRRHVAVSRKRAEQDRRGVVAAQLDLAEREARERDDDGEHQTEA